MKTRNLFTQVAVMVIAASVIAIVANGFSGRTRKLVLPGYYPNALRVPPRAPDTPMAAPATAPAVTATTATVAQSPGPGQLPVAVPAATVERPAGTATAPVATTTVAVTTSAAVPKAAVPEPKAPAVAAPAVDVSRFQPHPDKAFVEISGADAAALHASGALFLDARRTSVYEAGHIAGARSFSVWESDVDAKVNHLFNERGDPAEQNKPIVIYCSGGACEDSHMLSQKLWGIQFNNIYVYKDGFPDWQNRNGATRTGGQP